MKGPIHKIHKPFHVHCIFVIKRSPTISNDKKKRAYFQYKAVITDYNTKHLTTDVVNVLFSGGVMFHLHTLKNFPLHILHLSMTLFYNWIRGSEKNFVVMFRLKKGKAIL
jgi:hypothetical protein